MPRLFADTPVVQERTELRRQIGHILEERLETIVSDAVAVFPFTAPQVLDADYCARLCELCMQLLVTSVRDGRLDARNGVVADLRRLAQDRSVSIPDLFGLAYLLERTAIDELALHESFGATSEPWPSIAQLVRRGSFDVLGAFAEHLTREPGEGSLVDPLTTLHTRDVLVAALDKELQRSERFDHPLALILLDVDRLSDINAAHGYGFGDRVLERIGIVMRNYFREQDWVARIAEDTFAVLLPETPPEYAEALAERVRGMVEQRLALRDYRTEQRVQVTVSAAVLIADAVEPQSKAEDVLRHAEQAVHRAKHAGRNRVERVDLSARTLSVPAAAKHLKVSEERILQLVNEGRLQPTHADQTLRFERTVIEQFQQERSDQCSS